MTARLEQLTWPLAEAAEAIEALLRTCGLSLRSQEIRLPPLAPDETRMEVIGQWIESVAALSGAEAEPVETAYPEVSEMVGRLAPGVVLIRVDEVLRLALIVSGGRRRVEVLSPSLSRHRLPVEHLRAALTRGLESRFGPEVDRVLDMAHVPRRRRAQARRVILCERLAPARVGGSWLLRLPPGASIFKQIHRTGLTRHLVVLLSSHFLQYVLFLGSWWVIGRGALQGRLDAGWLVAWILMLLTMIPFRALTVWSQGLFSIGAGGLLKRRLLFGALHLHPDMTRHQGSGQLLGRVIESEVVEALALSGGFLGLMALVELVLATLVLSAGAAGWLHIVLLAFFLGATALLAWQLYRRQSEWTLHRLDLTNDLVERMVGHRTRLAQEPPERWHDFEDQGVERYLLLSRAMDRAVVRLVALVPRGWILVGVAAIGPAFVAGQAGLVSLAVALGGILLAYRALFQLCMGLSYLSSAAISWRQVAPLFEAAAFAQAEALPLSGSARSSGEPADDHKPTVLEADRLLFRYRDKGDPVLKECNLHIHRGDRLLLEGPSGGGKSTLVSLLVGLRQPDSGLLLLAGMDRRTLGAEHWRQRVVAAPQFHENHVMTETFAFNLLMGRQWPPLPEDMREAEAICQELGLADLLRRMPGGMLQTVGDTGWQLSHGERSRLFIARTLLQRAELIVLDESFASLDPENLRQALTCVLNRAPTLLVVAHP